MGGKEQIMYRVNKYGVACVPDAEMEAYFPGIYSIPNGECAETPQQQIEKFCWENVLQCRTGKLAGMTLFWKAADEEPQLKEQP